MADARGDDDEVLLVNIWQNTDGEMKLTERKPVTRADFTRMQKEQDFTQLL